MLPCVAGLLLAVAAGHAQAQASPDRSVDEYRNAARRALHACSRAIADSRSGARAGEGGPPTCIAEAKNSVAGRFDAAMTSTMDPVLRAALQRHQAAFVVSLRGLAPLPGEAATGYLQRQTGLNCALSHAWSDVERSEGDDRLRTATSRP
jgi:hypothetical protein